MLVSVLRDTYLLHVDDGLNGIQRVCEQLGLFRLSAVRGLRVEVECSPEEHNTQVINAAWPKEAFKSCRFPAGTVVWYDDPVLGRNFRASAVIDPAAMSNSDLFREGSNETWFVNGRCRFFMRAFQSPEGIEVCSQQSLIPKFRGHAI